MPMFNDKSGTYETSVFKTQNLTDEETKQIAIKYILKHLSSGRSIYGTAQFRAVNATDSNLEVSISEPPPRHLNLIGWPTEKSERMLKAKELAKKCNLGLFQNKLKA